MSLKSGKTMPGTWDGAINMPLEKADVPRSTVGDLYCPERGVGGEGGKKLSWGLRHPWTLKHRSSCRAGASQWLWSRSRWAEVRDTKCSRKKAEPGCWPKGALRGWAWLAEKGCGGIFWGALLR